MGSVQSASHLARLQSRNNVLTNTAGVAPGYVQANLLALPAAYADDFHDLCLRNPVACPLLGVAAKGNPRTIEPAKCIQSRDFDIRTDIPRYRVYQHGKHTESRSDILDVWTTDHVGFLIGCSFSFEDALSSAGLPPRHHLTGSIVPMYRTDIPLSPAGIFVGCKCVVSMRPYRPEHIERVRDVTRPYLATHGEPIAWGWDGARKLGIADIENPDFGDPPTFQDREVPVFWVGFPDTIPVLSSTVRIDADRTWSTGLRCNPSSGCRGHCGKDRWPGIYS